MCQSVVAAGQQQPRPLSAKTVKDVDTKRLGTLPTATGIAWLAYAYARRAGIELAPLLKKAGLTDPQIKDRSARLVVHHQIQFLNLAANALRDDSLGFHLAQQLPDLRDWDCSFMLRPPQKRWAMRCSERRGTTRLSMRDQVSRGRRDSVGVRVCWCCPPLRSASDRVFTTVLIRLCRGT